MKSDLGARVPTGASSLALRRSVGPPEPAQAGSRSVVARPIRTRIVRGMNPDRRVRRIEFQGSRPDVPPVRTPEHSVASRPTQASFALILTACDIRFPDDLPVNEALAQRTARPQRTTARKVGATPPGAQPLRTALPSLAAPGHPSGASARGAPRRESMRSRR